MTKIIQEKKKPTQEKGEKNSQDIGTQQKKKKITNLHTLEAFIFFLENLG